MKLFYHTFAAFAALVPTVGTAMAETVNYFGVEGTEWMLENISTSTPEGLVGFGGMVMGDPGELQGRGCMQIYAVGDTGRRAVGYIATEGEKVYFLDKDGAQWRLMYDFGLRPGETTVVWGAATQLVMGSAQARPYEVECLSVEPVEDTGLEMMHVRFTSDGEVGPGEDVVGEDTWIRGLGSTSGPCHNDIFAWVGVGSMLIEAESDGKILYSREPYIPVDNTFVNYFGREGSTWTTLISGDTYQETEPAFKEIITLGAPCVKNYRAAWPLLHVTADGSTRESGYYVSAYMNRVWLAAPDLEWRLIYDFGLEPGSSTVVYSNINISDPEWNPEEYVAQCIGVSPMEGNPGLEEMRLQLTSPTMDYWEQRWIRCVGGYAGMLFNGPMLFEGVSMALESLCYDGEEVYHKPGSSIGPEAGITTAADADVDGSAAIYDLSGRAVKEAQPGEIYIRQGKKVLVK